MKLALLPSIHPRGRKQVFNSCTSEPAWHHPSETHLFWSWKWESNHNPEAEPALCSPSGFSAVLPALGRSVLVPQSLLCNDAKAKPSRRTGTGGVASAEPVSGGGWSW